MSGMNVKILKCVIWVALAAVFCGCQYRGSADVDADDILSKQKIIFIMRSISYSEGYESRGYFVDNEGYRHYYDMTRYFLSKRNDDAKDDDIYADRDDIGETYDYLLEHFDDYEKEEFMELEDLKTCVRLLYNVNEGAKVADDGEPAIADYPGHEIYGVKADNGNVNFIWLIDRGAYFNWLDDTNAKKIVELFGSDWMKSSKTISGGDPIRLKEEQQEKANMKKAEISGDDGTLTVYVPETWECVGFPQTEKDGSYSIRIKPDASYDGYISISFEYQFGVCGTGLEEKEIQLAWDKAYAGYYDGSDKWSFIAYKGKNDKIVALNNAGDWFDDYEEEIMKILDYISFDPEYFLDHEHKSFKNDDVFHGDDIGVSLAAKDVSATGADLYFICHSDDKEHEYFYGDYYSLYVYNEGNKEFEPVFEGDMVFDDIAYCINWGEASDFSINWAKTCGRLKPGLYRLEKIVNDKNYDPKKDKIRDYKFWVDFVIYEGLSEKGSTDERLSITDILDREDEFYVISDIDNPNVRTVYLYYIYDDGYGKGVFPVDYSKNEVIAAEFLKKPDGRAYVLCPEYTVVEAITTPDSDAASDAAREIGTYIPDEISDNAASDTEREVGGEPIFRIYEIEPNAAGSIRFVIHSSLTSEITEEWGSFVVDCDRLTVDDDMNE